MKSISFTLGLLGLSALFIAANSQAQGNGPLTGSMGAASAQAAASTSSAVSAQPPAAPPLQTITLPPAQPVAQAAPEQGGITGRPVVRQVATPLPVTQAPAQAAAPQTAAAPRPAGDDIRDDHGALVRALLAAQADGRRAGPPLPMLGPVATASWDRYLESFKHPIPEWFRERVEAQSGGN